MTYETSEKKEDISKDIIMSSGETPDDPVVTEYTWYKDEDGDGYSDGTTITAAEQPAGYFLPSVLTDIKGDDNDNDPSVYPGMPDPRDADNDGDGFTENQGDFDDTSADIYPGAVEICGNGIDEDCNGSDMICAPAPEDTDNDGDGVTENQGDCNDADANVHPGAVEICGDQIDNNCNDQTDENCAVPTYTLTVSKTGNGSGIIRTTGIEDIFCGDKCSADFEEGTEVRLYAYPDEGSEFAGWSGGGCSGMGECVVTADGGKNVTATFSKVVMNTWTRTFGSDGGDVGYSILQTTDGNYVIAGVTDNEGYNTDNVYLIKIDQNGNMIWDKTYGGDKSDVAYSVQQTSEDNLIVAGSTKSNATGIIDLYLLQINQNGNLIWENKYG